MAWLYIPCFGYTEGITQVKCELMLIYGFSLTMIMESMWDEEPKLIKS